MPRSFLVPALAVVLAATAPRAQDVQPQIRMDTGTFAYSAEQSLVETYLSVTAASLHFVRDDTGVFVATLPLQLTVRPTATAAPSGAENAPVFERPLAIRVVVADTSVLGDAQVFTEQVRATLAPGEYDLALRVADETNTYVNLEIVSNLTVPAYQAASGPAISTIQLARRIAAATEPGSPFAKSGLVVQPNPSAFYGEGLPRAPYYAEVYGIPATQQRYTLLTYLSDSTRPTPIDGTERRTSRVVRPVDVIAGAVDVSALPSGEYYLHLAVLDAANEAVAETSKRLYVINPAVARPDMQIAEAEDDELLYAAMSEEELALNLDHARVVASERDRQDLNELSTDEARRAYLVRFWRARAQDASTTPTAARRTFYERIDRVNTEFDFGNTPGYKTDRGRIYLVYGPPSGIDRQAFNADTAPFEVWSYENIPGEGPAQFVFVDRYQSSEMELVHSDVTGEVSVPNWQQELLNR